MIREIAKSILPQSVQNFIINFLEKAKYPKAGLTSKQYWSQHVISLPGAINSLEDSMKLLDWRNKHYWDILKLMPVSGADDKVVLDYGCGPGHDLVGFGIASKPQKLLGADVSPKALQIAERRLSLHKIPCELILLDSEYEKIPLQDKSVGLIHSSGVIHHTPDPVSILREFKRVLRDNGKVQIMVYNYNSVWMHLYVSYLEMIKKKRLKGENKKEIFRKTTDGPTCPISNCYKPEEFIELAASAGFDCQFRGAAINLEIEMPALQYRFEAITNKMLDKESRDFLYNLSFNKQGIPLYNGEVAGIDACFDLKPRRT